MNKTERKNRKRLEKKSKKLFTEIMTLHHKMIDDIVIQEIKNRRSDAESHIGMLKGFIEKELDNEDTMSEICKKTLLIIQERLKGIQRWGSSDLHYCFRNSLSEN